MRYKIFLSLIMVVLITVVGLSQGGYSAKEAPYFIISDVPIPDDIILEVGGLAFDEAGILGVTTRRGEFWRIANPESNQPKFTRFAQGLHEPLGLAYRDGAYYVAQRGELTKITDTDGDGTADKFENIFNWDLAGNYHEYAYGPKFLPNGDMIISLNLGWIGRGASLSKWSGWMLQIKPDGSMTPLAAGMRSPAGFNFNKDGDLFYTENQGDWVGSGRMTHIEKGVFAGHPESLKWSGEKNSPISLKMDDIKDDIPTTLFEESKKIPALRAPAIWFPHTIMGISTSDVMVVPEVWPFAGQLLVGDQGHSKIMRVYQEKVNGVYQGICFPFREGFASGLLRMEWGSDEAIYVGMTSRGWAATGKAPYGLQRLKWSGKMPFEMEKVEIQSDGFLITFTAPVDKRTAANPDSYAITDFNFKYHHLYGSAPIMTEDRVVYKVELGQDGKSVKLFVEGLRPGFVNEIKAEGVKSMSGQELLHPVGYYTINEIPGEGAPSGKVSEASGEMDHSEHDMTGSKFVETPSAKRVTEMPAEWKDGPDVILEIEAIPGMMYDKKIMMVQPGQRVKLVFNNPDDMAHNLLIVQPGKGDAVAARAMNLGLKGEEMGFIPEGEEIIVHTTLLRPNSSDVIYFTAPEKKGNYQYICTFPGHAATMRGILMVK
ncbi:MAG: plastocyanin/azurin family copper-binding protein [Saprospiraceae bacterium]